MREPKKTVAFRLDRDILALLTAKAKELGVSPGAFARVLVTEALLGQSYLLDEIRELSERQLQHEKHFRTATVALLVDAGKANVEEAQAFAREQLS
jgi:hypothetical protein